MKIPFTKWYLYIHPDFGGIFGYHNITWDAVTYKVLNLKVICITLIDEKWENVTK